MLTGTLADIGIVELIQFPHTGRKTGELLINGKEMKARLFYDNGALHHALAGENEGLAALIEIVDWKEGQFEFHLNIRSEKKTIQLDLHRAVMQALKVRDERRQAEEEARRKAEEEARRRAEEEARRRAEEEARRRAEEEARRKAEEEARRKAEEDARRKVEEERRRAEEEARRKAEEDARRRVEEERRRAEEEARRKAEEEARRQDEETRRKAREEAEMQRIDGDDAVDEELAESVEPLDEDDASDFRPPQGLSIPQGKPVADGPMHTEMCGLLEEYVAANSWAIQAIVVGPDGGLRAEANRGRPAKQLHELRKAIRVIQEVYPRGGPRRLIIEDGLGLVIFIRRNDGGGVFVVAREDAQIGAVMMSTGKLVTQLRQWKL